MPNLKSGAKRMRSDAKLREHNTSVLSELKTISKKLYALAAKEPKKAAEYAVGVDQKVRHSGLKRNHSPSAGRQKKGPGFPPFGQDRG